MALINDLPLAVPPEMEARYRAAWRSDDLLDAVVPLAATSRVLMLGCAADPFCLVVARRVAEGWCECPKGFSFSYCRRSLTSLGGPSLLFPGTVRAGHARCLTVTLRAALQP